MGVLGEVLWSNSFAPVGSNTTVTVQSYNGTIPSLPQLGKALSKLKFDVQIPGVPVRRAPGKEPDDDQGPSFIQDATVLSTFMELVSLRDGYNLQESV